MGFKDLARSVISSKLIACVASCHPGKGASCLDLSNAAQVILESRTCTLVYNIPTDYESIRDSDTFKWSFPQLLDKLYPNNYILLSNTSRAKNADEVIEKALLGRDVFRGFRHYESQNEPIIKLEVLDRSLRSDNDAVIIATEELISHYKMMVFPLISPDLAKLHILNELGVPLVRILAGEIGSMNGLDNRSELRNLAKHSNLPLFFEGGIGTADHVKDALDLGATGVLMNAAFQRSKNPIHLAQEVRKILDLYSSRNNLAGDVL